MKDQKILNFLKEDKQEKAFSRLYRYYPKVEKHILINSGSKEEALDIFQDALVLLYQKANDGYFDTHDNQERIDGFLIQSAKLLWSNELRKKKVRDGDEGGLSGLKNQDEVAQKIEQEKQFEIIEQALKRLGKKCQDILDMFYYRSYSMDKIAQKIGFKTVKSAKVQKYKCMESARKFALQLSNQNTIES